MLRIIIRIACVFVVVALVVFVFLHALPIIIKILAAVALIKICHAWLCGKNGPFPSWPWRKDDGAAPQPAA